MTSDQPDLSVEAERIAADILKRRGKAIRRHGEWFISTTEANKLLPYGPRYIQGLRGTLREIPWMTFSADNSPSKHYWYSIVVILALAKIHGGEDYFPKAA